MDNTNSNKYLSTEEVLGAILSENRTSEESLLIKRFLDKIGDSTSYAEIFSRELRQLSLNQRDADFKKIEAGERVVLLDSPRITLEKDMKSDSWTVMHRGEVFLDKLASKIAHKICVDINVAFNILDSRLSRGKLS